MGERKVPLYQFFPIHTEPEKLVLWLQQELGTGLKLVDFSEVGLYRPSGWLFQLDENWISGVEQQVSYFPIGQEAKIAERLEGKYLDRIIDVKTGYLVIWSEQSSSLVGTNEGFFEVLLGRWIPNMWPVWFICTIASVYFWLKT
jgi:hypothetical protein